MTSTDSGMIDSSASTSFTRRPPATSTSRRGLRSTTFTSAHPSWKPGARLDVADLAQVDRVVLRLELPPLGQIEVAEPEVLEDQRARVDVPELLDRLPAAHARRLHLAHERVD